MRVVSVAADWCSDMFVRIILWYRCAGVSCCLLSYGCTRCILVGDPKQLPATVLSRAAISKGYSRSLFARLADGGYRSYLMDVQVLHGSLALARLALPHAEFCHSKQDTWLAVLSCRGMHESTHRDISGNDPRAAVHAVSQLQGRVEQASVVC